MARDWIERRNDEMLGQARNFSARLSADYATYHVSATDAVLLAADLAEFESAYSAASAPVTRTVVAVARQRIARQKLAARMRDLGGRIRADRKISTTLKLLLGLTVRGSRDDAGSSGEGAAGRVGRIGVPRTRPIVFPGGRGTRGGAGAGAGKGGGVVHNPVSGDEIRIHFLDEANTMRNTRPAGTLGAGVWYAISAQPPPHAEDWHFVRLFTRSTAHFTLASRVLSRFAAAAGADPGETVALTVWIAARWISPTGAPGPASRPISLTVLAQADRAAVATLSEETIAAPRVAA